jgi:hypothetical protein
MTVMTRELSHANRTTDAPAGTGRAAPDPEAPYSGALGYHLDALAGVVQWQNISFPS